MEGIGEGRIVGGEGAGAEIGDLEVLQHRLRRGGALLCRTGVHGPVGQWRDAHFIFEEAGEGILLRIVELPGDLRHGQVGVGQEGLGPLHLPGGDVVAEVHAGLAFEQAAEVGGAQEEFLGHPGEGDVLLHVLVDVLPDAEDLPAGGVAAGEHLADVQGAHFVEAALPQGDGRPARQNPQAFAVHGLQLRRAVVLFPEPFGDHGGEAHQMPAHGVGVPLHPLLQPLPVTLLHLIGEFVEGLVQLVQKCLGIGQGLLRPLLRGRLRRGAAAVQLRQKYPVQQLLFRPHGGQRQVGRVVGRVPAAGSGSERNDVAAGVPGADGADHGGKFRPLQIGGEKDQFGLFPVQLAQGLTDP